MLIKKGAEASLFLEEWYGYKVIVKRRLTKKYRLAKLDKIMDEEKHVDIKKMVKRIVDKSIIQSI